MYYGRFENRVVKAEDYPISSVLPFIAQVCAMISTFFVCGLFVCFSCIQAMFSIPHLIQKLQYNVKFSLSNTPLLE